MNKIGRVLRVVGANCLVYADNKEYDALCPKLLKLQGLCAGDLVEFIYDDSLNNNLILKVLERKNHIDRPNVSNVDNAFIVISEVPKPDFYIIDKILVSLNIENIVPYIIISKLDIINESFIDEIKKQYSNCVKEIIMMSALNNVGLEPFINATKDKVSVLVGQSAVGKSSLLNALGIDKIKTNPLALKVGKKIERGRNTTKNSQLYLTNYGAFIADTPGFKALDLETLTETQLTHYFVDIRDYAVKCKYADCTHLPNNEGCAVVKALQEGKINKDRYDRYIRLKNTVIRNRKNYGN